MSMHHNEICTCPQCGKNSEFTVWSSIDIQENPEMKGRVESLEAFTFVCPHCGQRQLIDYNFLYNDGDNRLMIYQVVDDEGETAARRSFGGRGISALKSFLPYTFRIVRSLDELLEKMRIAGAGLDDRIIELFKVLAMRQAAALYPEFHGSEGWFIQNGEGKWIIHLIDGEADQALDVDYEDSFRELYGAVAREYKIELDEKSKDVFVIDQAWAEEFVKTVMT